jgi:DNA-binding NarL/FixJ family response regulator
VAVLRYPAPLGLLYSLSAASRQAELPDRAEPTSRLDALTAREREVLTLMAEGRSNRGICEALVLSSKTVEAHIKQILLKLDIATAPEDHRRVLAVLSYLRP